MMPSLFKSAEAGIAVLYPMPMVIASNWSMTPFPSTSPAARLTSGMVVMLPAVSVAKPWAPRNPSAEAVIPYEPAGAVRLNVPSALAITEAAMELSALSKRMVTGFPASACPFTTGADTGVGVGVSAPPLTVRIAGPRDKILTRAPSPLDTRAMHSIEVCPVCNPVALKVKAAPLVVARRLLLPAMAKTKLPFCGPLSAVAGSAPKRPAAAMLLTSIRAGSYEQTNSALE